MFSCPVCKKKYSGASGLWYHKQNNRNCYPVPPAVHRKPRLAKKKKPTNHCRVRVDGLKVRICLSDNKQEDLDYCMALAARREALDVQCEALIAQRGVARGGALAGWDLPPEVDQADIFWDMVPGVEFKDTSINAVNKMPVVVF